MSTKQFFAYVIYINFVAGFIAGVGTAYLIGEFL